MLCNEHKAELETKIDTITGVYKTFDFFSVHPNCTFESGGRLEVFTTFVMSLQDPGFD